MNEWKEARKHRIAMVCDFFYPRLGGVENHILSLSHHLIRLGHKVIVITHAYGNRKGVRYLSESLKVYYCPIVPMTDQDALPTFLATLPLIRCILLREQIEIVHAHQATSTMANESIVYGSALGLKTIYTDHSLFGFDDVASIVLNRVLQVTTSTLDAAICVSHTCRDNFMLRARVQKPDKVTVIPNAIDASRFTPASLVAHEDKDEQNGTNTASNNNNHKNVTRIKVVVVSRLVYRKGVDILVGVIPIICRECPNVDFIIGGDGNKLLMLQEMVERERLDHRVEFLGAVPSAQVRNVLIRGHVFLNCSLTESFCIAILEAASCGLAVVSTNVGGVVEVLPSDLIRLAIPNVKDMVERLKQAIISQSNPETALDRQNTHERVKKMYSWRRVAQETIRVYDRVMEQDLLDFWGRLKCYQSMGGMTGMVICCLVLVFQVWFNVVEWWQPVESIEIVPDLMPMPSNEENTTTRANTLQIEHLEYDWITMS
jgi:phosphatidylinositol glycan class A protein